MLTAEIVSVGTEILMGQIVDTNAQCLGALFPELGIRHVYRQTVGDNLERLTEALRLALSRSDIVFTIGGLGPTVDDITRDGIAAALDEKLVLDEALERRLRKMWAVRKLPWTESQLRQAMRPPCAEPIENPNGSAVGLLCRKDGKTVIAMPGPRGEFVPMANGAVRDYLASVSTGEVIHSRLLRISGMGESMVEEKIRPLLMSENPTVAPYAKVGEVHLRISARAASAPEADSLIAPVEGQIRQSLGEHIFGTDETSLEQAVVQLLSERKKTVAVAESMTGGWLGQRLTSVPGSSSAFVGGVICYTKKSKSEVLGVDERLLDDPAIGPVSNEAAKAIAEGARRLFKADIGVGITGNAGPTSDEGDKPVGLVYVAVADENGARFLELNYRGIRDDIRMRATQTALHMLRERVLRYREVL